MENVVNRYNDFKKVIDDAFLCIQFSNTHISSLKGSQRLKREYVHSMYESSFLKVFTSWERFLENCFVAYLAGASANKFKPTIYLKKITKKHALDILSGTKDYPDWTNIDDVCKLARLYFRNGVPFVQPLREIETYFIDIKKVRNAIAHISLNSKTKFQGLLKSRLASYRTNMSPGEFLSLRVSKKIKECFFEYYISYLDVASQKIIKI